MLWPRKSVLDACTRTQKKNSPHVPQAPPIFVYEPLSFLFFRQTRSSWSSQNHTQSIMDNSTGLEAQKASTDSSGNGVLQIRTIANRFLTFAPLEEGLHADRSRNWPETSELCQELLGASRKVLEGPLTKDIHWLSHLPSSQSSTPSAETCVLLVRSCGGPMLGRAELIKPAQ